MIFGPNDAIICRYYLPGASKEDNYNNGELYYGGKTTDNGTTIKTGCATGKRGSSITSSANWYTYEITAEKTVEGCENGQTYLTVYKPNGDVYISKTPIGDFTTVSSLYLRFGQGNAGCSHGVDDISFALPAPVKIGDTGYATFAKAAAAATSGQTITLLSNIVLTESVTLKMGVALDFGGYTLTTTDADVEVKYDNEICSLKSTTDAETGVKTFSNEIVVSGYAWTGAASDGKWTTAHNWYNDTLPTADAAVVFPASIDAAEVDLTDAGTISSLTVNRPVTFTNGGLTVTTIDGASQVTLDAGAGFYPNGSLTVSATREIAGSDNFITATAGSQKITLSSSLKGSGILTLDRADNSYEYEEWIVSGTSARTIRYGGDA